MHQARPFALVLITVLSWQMVRCEYDDSYNKKIRPFDEGPPVDIKLGVYIESLGAIREATMEFSLTMYFREEWVDPRLAHNKTEPVFYVASAGDILWSPDLFFLYEKNGREHDVTLPNVVIKVFPDGWVFRSTRLSITAACYMDLHRFPFDAQICTLNAMSYSYPITHLQLYIGDDDVDVEPGLSIPSFKMTKIETKNITVPYSTGNFSLAVVQFHFQRQMQSFLLTVYIPSILLVTVAWLSFCIDAQAAPARVSLGITTVLTITTMTAGIQESLPVVTYAKAIDIWLAACLVFVFVALLEYALANYLLLLQAKREERRKARAATECSQTSDRDSPLSNKSGLDEERLSRYQTQYFSPGGKGDNMSGAGHCEENPPMVYGEEMYWTSTQLDRMARYVYPMLFLIFNLVYWPVCIWVK
ncbi:glycine receptor subunit alpha-3-like [Diadema setosum]|uniref:glycine receptor subunit alpha-3-like n=1 Tax=Diadema setosum TaxID=31175 RepID=UPI003B3AABD7